MCGDPSGSRGHVPFFSGYRRLALFGVILFAAVLGGWRYVYEKAFEFRYGAILPFGVSGPTKVTSISWRPPPGLSKTWSREIREFFNCYYPELSHTNSSIRVPKTLEDILDEYEARVENGQLKDASGRKMCIMKTRASSDPSDWLNRHRDLVMDGYTVLVVDVEENQ